MAAPCTGTAGHAAPLACAAALAGGVGHVRDLVLPTAALRRAGDDEVDLAGVAELRDAVLPLVREFLGVTGRLTRLRVVPRGAPLCGALGPGFHAVVHALGDSAVWVEGVAHGLLPGDALVTLDGGGAKLGAASQPLVVLGAHRAGTELELLPTPPEACSLAALERDGALAGFSRFRVDVGLSYNAPVAAAWLAADADPALCVVGLEPHPGCVHELWSGMNRLHGALDPWGQPTTYLPASEVGARFRLVPAAVDDVPDEGVVEADFHATSRDPGCSSLCVPSARCERVAGAARKIRVPCVPLARVLRALPPGVVEHLKTDCQGADLRVLRSAGELLAERVLYVTPELETGDLYASSHTRPEIEAFLASRGFTAVSPHTWANSRLVHLRASVAPDVLIN